MCALTLGLFWAAIFRYEVEFLPALLLLAVVGILGLEYALVDRPVWRRTARWGWGLLLGFSVAFNLLASAEHYAVARTDLGVDLLHLGKTQEAITQLQQAVRLDPDYVEAHYNLGVVLEQTGNIQEAIGHYEQALRLEPDLTEVRNALARLHAGQ
jgi:tetratricopeptide (TPR) repeat protein